MELEELNEIIISNITDLFDALGIEYRPKGKDYELICPFHHDTAYGNARWHLRYFHCFACNAHKSALGLIMEMNNCPFPNAIKIAKSIYGITEEMSDTYMMSDYYKYRLCKDEMEIIDIPNGISLRVLYEMSPEKYFAIINSKIEKSRKRYLSVIENYGGRDGEKAYELYSAANGKITAYEFENIRVEAIKRLEKIDEIKRRLSY